METILVLLIGVGFGLAWGYETGRTAATRRYLGEANRLHLPPPKGRFPWGRGKGRSTKKPHLKRLK